MLYIHNAANLPQECFLLRFVCFVNLILYFTNVSRHFIVDYRYFNDAAFAKAMAGKQN
jgi:hypothetical protein